MKCISHSIYRWPGAYFYPWCPFRCLPANLGLFWLWLKRRTVCWNIASLIWHCTVVFGHLIHPQCFTYYTYVGSFPRCLLLSSFIYSISRVQFLLLLLLTFLSHARRLPFPRKKTTTYRVISIYIYSCPLIRGHRVPSFVSFSTYIGRNQQRCSLFFNVLYVCLFRKYQSSTRCVGSSFFSFFYFNSLTLLMCVCAVSVVHALI